MKTLLIIDDDAAFRKILSGFFAPRGWRIHEAEEGEEGLRLAAQTKPNLVLCDLLMPRCNGFQVCRAIRADPEYGARAKIVVTTGSGYATDRLNALEAGADRYLTKPFKLDALLELISEMDGFHPGAPAPESSEETRLTFWGVRGSIPTPGPTTVFYGGNTSCLEVRAGSEIIILDAGTGIRPLGAALKKEFEGRALRATILISHTHWDHIQGFPFFRPAYNPANDLRLLSYEGAIRGLEAVLASQMQNPYFPITMEQMPGAPNVRELKETEFHLGSVRVKSMFLNHPGICAGYRLFTPSGSIAYLPDNELSRRGTVPKDEQALKDAEVREFIRDADVAVMDAQYDALEYPRHVNWGHSCVEDVVLMAMEANVKKLFLFHHDPDHDDSHVAQMLARGRQMAREAGSRIKIEAAREGLEVVLAPQPTGP